MHYPQREHDNVDSRETSPGSESSCGHSDSNSPPRGNAEADVKDEMVAEASILKYIFNPQLLEPPPRESYAHFIELVTRQFCLQFDSAAERDALYVSWRRFCKTEMPAEALPHECALSFVEHLGGQRHNPRYDPESRSAWPLVSMSAVLSPLSGTDLLIAKAVREVCEPGCMSGCRAHRIFFDTVSGLRMSAAMKKVFYVLWRVKANDSADSDLLRPRLTNRLSIDSFLKERLRRSPYQDECDAAKEKDAMDTAKLKRFVELVQRRYHWTFTNEKAKKKIYDEWCRFHRCIAPCASFMTPATELEDVFACRADSNIDPKHTRVSVMWPHFSDAAELGLAQHLLMAFSYNGQDDEPFHAFYTQQSARGLTWTALVVQYAVWGHLVGSQSGGYWAQFYENRVDGLERLWLEFFGQFQQGACRQPVNDLEFSVAAAGGLDKPLVGLLKRVGQWLWNCSFSICE